MRVVGLVLAGGRSTRFGSEKAVADFHGRPMIAWVADALSHGCEAVAVNAPEGSGAAAWAAENALPLVGDPRDYPDGPLTGVLEGLRWAAKKDAGLLVTAPCDTPNLPPEMTSRLAAALAGASCACAVSVEGSHPLCAAWATDRLPFLEAVLAEGHPSVRRLLEDWGAAEVVFENAGAFANINTRGDASTSARSTP